MAKSKKNKASKPKPKPPKSPTRKAPAGAPSRGKQTHPSPGPKKTMPRVSYTSQVKDINNKYSQEGGVPKRLDQSLASLRKEIRQAMAPVYRLHKKIDEAPSKYYAAKYRKELREYEQFIAPHINDLKDRRQDYVTLQKAKVHLREQEKTTKRELKKLEKQIKKADETKDYAALEKLTYQIVKLQGNLDAMGAALGRPIQVTDVDEYETSDEEDEAGYLEDPNNPYVIWQAIKQLEIDITSGNWDYIVIDGSRYSTKNIGLIRVAASEFWLILKRPRTDTPRVNRYYNLEKRSVKYKTFKS